MQNRISDASSARERGFVLVTVIWGIGLVSLFVLTFVLNVRTQTKLATNLITRAQLEAHANAGVNLAILDLLSTAHLLPERRRFAHTGKAVAWTISDKVTLQISVQDEEGKLDLNTASTSMLKSVLLHLTNSDKLASQYADSIVDFRDFNKVRLPNGAEEKEYKDAGKKSGPKNYSFQSVEELHQVLNLTPALIQKLKPLVTIFSKRNGIDPTVAPAALKAALSKGNEVSQLYRITSNRRVFLVRVAAMSGGGAFVREAVVEVDRSVGPGYRVLAWGVGDLAERKGEASGLLAGC